MLPETTFRSAELAPADRFESWRALMSQTHAPMEMHSEYAADFWVNQRVISLGGITVYPMECRPLTFRRTPKLIARSDPEHFHLSLIKRGAGAVTLGKDTVVHGVFDIHTSDTSRPFDISSGPHSVEIIGVEVPKALLPLPPQTMRPGHRQAHLGPRGNGGPAGHLPRPGDQGQPVLPVRPRARA